MDLEKKVSSYVLSKRLKELGVEQSSIFYWCESWGHKPYVVRDRGGKKKHPADYCSAFISDELGEMLPDNCYAQKDCGTLPVEWICYRFINYDEDPNKQEDVWIADTEANCKAKMLIYLIEQDLLMVVRTRE